MRANFIHIGCSGKCSPATQTQKLTHLVDDAHALDYGTRIADNERGTVSVYVRYTFSPLEINELMTLWEQVFLFCSGHPPVPV